MRRRDFMASVGAAAIGATTLTSAPVLAAEAPRISHEADVVIVGANEGGLGGCVAAIAAARRGAKTILIETAGTIGLHVPIGLGVVIGIPGWKPAMSERLFRELAELLPDVGQHDDHVWTKDELLKSGRIIVRYHDVVIAALLQMLRDAGVTMLFHTRPADVVMNREHVESVIVQSPQGRH